MENANSFFVLISRCVLCATSGWGSDYLLPSNIQDVQLLRTSKRKISDIERLHVSPQYVTFNAEFRKLMLVRINGL